MDPTPTPSVSPTAMGEILESGTDLFGWVLSGLGTIVTTITSNPILLIGFLIVLCGFVVGITKRLMNIQ